MSVVLGILSAETTSCACGGVTLFRKGVQQELVFFFDNHNQRCVLFVPAHSPAKIKQSQLSTTS